MNTDAWDVEAIRRHFVFPRTGRVVTNNAASTQPPRELLDFDGPANEAARKAFVYKEVPAETPGDLVTGSAWPDRAHRRVLTRYRWRRGAAGCADPHTVDSVHHHL